MFVTDVVIEGDSLGLLKAKLRTSLVFMVLLVIGFVASLAMIIIGIANKVSDVNTYLFSGFGMLIAGFWFVIAYNEHKKSTLAIAEINEKGSHTISGAIEVNAEHKFNTSSILNLVCAILVTVCFVIEIVLQLVEFNILTLYIIPITLVLGVYMAYQTIIGFINDKLYRKVIFEK